MKAHVAQNLNTKRIVMMAPGKASPLVSTVNRYQWKSYLWLCGSEADFETYNNCAASISAWSVSAFIHAATCPEFQ